MLVQVSRNYNPLGVELKMKLGARIFKTGLSVVLAIYIAQLFNLEPAIFAAIAAVLTIQPSVYRSWEYMLQQFQANAIGATYATVAYLTLGNDPIVIGLVVMLVITTNLKLNLEKNAALSVITVIAIMNVPDGTYLFFAVERFGLILIGIISSLLLNLLFFPPKYEKTILSEFKKTDKNMSSLLRFLLEDQVDDKLYKLEKKKINEDIDKLDSLYNLYKEEFNSFFKKKGFREQKKIIIFKKILIVIKKERNLIKLIKNQILTNSNIPIETKTEIKNTLLYLASYNEKIFFKYEKDVQLTEPHEIPADLVINNEILAKKLFEFYQKEDIECWLLLLPTISALTELANDLESLEKSVDNYLLHNH